MCTADQISFSRSSCSKEFHQLSSSHTQQKDEAVYEEMIEHYR